MRLLACIPSKTLLRPPEARSEARRVAGTGTPTLTLEEVFDYRDYMIRNLDDSGQVKGYEGKGATVFKGTGRIIGPGIVEVDGEAIRADYIIIATGSDPTIPPIEGLEEVPVWTNREATTLKEVSERAVLVGGGPVGIELGQMLSRFGSEATIVQSADRLIDREDPRVSELIKAALEEEGIDVRLGQKVTKAHKDGEGAIVTLDDGAKIRTDVVVIAAGRRPRTEQIGLESVGVEPDGKGLPIDEYCRVAEGVWALGDVTGMMLFTHVAKYQARVVADNILGKTRRADYHGIPRVVFSDPEIAAAGLTEEQAKEQGIEVATATVDLARSIARPWTYEEDPRGHLGLVANRDRRVLVGAWAVAPKAGEWIHQASQAIRAEISIEKLRDMVAQFPTYSEAYLNALEELDI